MEDLNKQQLILLVLLVSFVTSIATGIITFSLLQKAPVEVTQNINRVVERTIEKVVTEEGNGGETVREVTTVVSEEDLVLESIDKNTKSIVRLKTLGADGSEIISGIGIVLAGNGVIVVDEKSFGSGNYKAVFHDGAEYAVSKSFKDPSSSIVFLKIGKANSDSYIFHPAVIGNPDILKLGQTIIAVGGRERNQVAIGRVSDIEKTGASVGMIYTDISFVRKQPGSPILNLNGEIIGFEASLDEGARTIHYRPITEVSKILKTAQLELAK
ncbi:MAG: serine protease [Patescibacteria group bacterium]